MFGIACRGGAGVILPRGVFRRGLKNRHRGWKKKPNEEATAESAAPEISRAQDLRTWWFGTKRDYGKTSYRDARSEESNPASLNGAPYDVREVIPWPPRTCIVPTFENLTNQGKDIDETFENKGRR